jgi:phage N-6-adenine-methyltransferase
VVADLAAAFGEFDLDPCCRAETAKAPKFYTETDDGLSQPWHGRVFMNPPYSDIAPWLKKAIAETQAGRAELVVALLPAQTDTRWFHELVLPSAELFFKARRIRFYGWHGTPIPAPRAPSILAVYRAP